MNVLVVTVASPKLTIPMLWLAKVLPVTVKVVPLPVVQPAFGVGESRVNYGQGPLVVDGAAVFSAAACDRQVGDGDSL